VVKWFEPHAGLGLSLPKTGACVYPPDA
jgi:cold shock CspA family protein